MTNTNRWLRRSFKTILGTAVTAAALWGITAHQPASAAEGKGFKLYPLGHTEDAARLSSTPIPYQKVPERPGMPIEVGCDFLGKGEIPAGFELPTGAVWTPCLFGFGTSRTAIQTYEGVGPLGRNTEIVTRLDAFLNLQLTSTDKCIVGVAPFDKNRFTNFTRYSFESNQGLEGGQGEFGLYLRTAFCEADLHSLFPKLDPKGTKLVDFGVSAGRQQITFQEGIMINDFLDAVGLVRNNLHAPGISNIRITGLYAWDHLDRGTPATRQRLNHGNGIFGLFTQLDTIATSVNTDFMVVLDDSTNSTGGDGYYFGIAAAQRGFNPFRGIGEFNTTYRINASFAPDGDTANVSDGVLVSSEISWTPRSSDDIVYFNTYWGFDRFSQAGREPIVGGPLAAIGIGFASPSLGNHLSEMNSFAGRSGGFALGYQAFWDNHRRNLVLELAGSKDNTRNFFSNDGAGTDQAALTVRYQHAIGQRVQLQADAFVAYLEGRTNGSGARFEVLVQF